MPSAILSIHEVYAKMKIKIANTQKLYPNEINNNVASKRPNTESINLFDDITTESLFVRCIDKIARIPAVTQ